MALVSGKLDESQEVLIENWKGLKNLLEMKERGGCDIYGIAWWGWTYVVGKSMDGEPSHKESAM
jgi:hypothetical protein